MTVTWDFLIWAFLSYYWMLVESLKFSKTYIFKLTTLVLFWLLALSVLLIFFFFFTRKEVFFISQLSALLSKIRAQQPRPKGSEVQVSKSEAQAQRVTDQGQSVSVRTWGSCTVLDLAPRLCPFLLDFCSPSDSEWQLEGLCLFQTQPGYPALQSVWLRVGVGIYNPILPGPSWG